MTLLKKADKHLNDAGAESSYYVAFMDGVIFAMKNLETPQSMQSRAVKNQIKRMGKKAYSAEMRRRVMMKHQKHLGTDEDLSRALAK